MTMVQLSGIQYDLHLGSEFGYKQDLYLLLTIKQVLQTFATLVGSYQESAPLN